MADDDHGRARHLRKSCPSGKIRYNDQKTAQGVVHDFPALKKSYWCSECKGYHTTRK